jgi:CHAT domain-containing protein/tetratricopeptide (TPR) repeat protein
VTWGEALPSVPYRATRNMVKMKQSVEALLPGEWHAVVVPTGKGPAPRPGRVFRSRLSAPAVGPGRRRVMLGSLNVDNWYYLLAGKEAGPVSLEHLEQLVASGKLRADNEVWKQGTPDWVRLRSVPQLARALLAARQAPPAAFEGTALPTPTLAQGDDGPPALFDQVVTRLFESGCGSKERGDLARARECFEQCLAVVRQARGAEYPDAAMFLGFLGRVARDQGDLAGARSYYEQALAAFSKACGPDHPDTAICLGELADLLEAQGDPAAALSCLEQLLARRRKAPGPDHPDTAACLNQIGHLLYAQGDLAGARPCFEEALGIFEKALGPDHLATAGCLGPLGLLLQAQGDLAGARARLEQALAVHRRAKGPNHPDTAVVHGLLGHLSFKMHDYEGARACYEEVLAIHRTALGPGHPETARSLWRLCLPLVLMEDFAGAKPCCEEALAVCEKALGPDHADTAVCLNNLGYLLNAMGDRAGARACYERALAVRRRALGSDHPLTAQSLNNLGLVLQEQEDLAGASAHCREALAIFQRTLHAGGPEAGAASLDETGFAPQELGGGAAGWARVAACLNNLGLLHHRMGDYEGAQLQYELALAALENLPRPDPCGAAFSLNNLGGLLWTTGDLAGARAYYERALAARLEVLGPNHRYTACSLTNLGVLLAAAGQVEEAFTRMRQAAAADDRTLGQVFAVGSDRQRTAFLHTIQGNTAAFLSLVWRHAPDDPAAARAALDLVLRRKGVLAEALAAQRDAVLGGKHPRLKARLNEWVALRRQIARRRLAGPGPEGFAAHRRQLDEAEAARECLEAELARQVPEMNLEQKLRSADHRAVALSLPAGVALVEFVHFDVFDFKAVPARGEARWQPARYLAFVLPAGEPDAVQMIDLGPAGETDRLIAEFRAGILRQGAACSRNMVRAGPDPAPSLVHQLGLPLRQAVLDPLVPALGPCRRLLLSPDGGLMRLPFELLPVREGRLLLDDYHISYVGSGRDVIRFAAPATRPGTEPLVIADPDFDLAGQAVAAQSTPRVGFWSRLFGRSPPAATASPPPAPASRPGKEGRLSRDFSRSAFHFARLPGTRAEGQQIADLLGVRPWLDGAALEGPFKERCRSPRILHLATHGFFLQDQPHDPNQERLGLANFGAEASRLAGPLPENPLLRAGLALAGANTWLRGGTPPHEAEDGLLTAEDVSGLDLLDTELVVLSACETGLGEVRAGEGVYGLQRAFVVAGARTLVMSLWSVPDEATRELMEDFYRRLLAGEPRADALHAAQQALRRKYPEPYFWGAFVCLGAPGPLATPAG